MYAAGANAIASFTIVGVVGSIQVGFLQPHLKAKIPRVATSPFSVVIKGESGIGKELIAGARSTKRGRAGGRSEFSCPPSERRGPPSSPTRTSPPSWA